MLHNNKFRTWFSIAVLILLSSCGGGGDDADAITPPAPPTSQFSLSITITGNGNVTDSANAINCNASCTVSLNENTVVNLNATPNSGFNFSSWEEACTGSSSCSITMSSNQMVTATFTQQNVGNIISRATNNTCIAPEQASTANANYQLQAAFPNLPALSDLVGMFQAPGDTSRWYAMSQSGLVQWFDNNPTANSLNTFIDLRSRVRNSGEQGLLGMAFDPQYSSNGRVYFSYINTDNGRNSIISRFTNQGNEPLAINTEQILLTLSQPASNHNGGGIGFGPDGNLYIGFGDGGGADDTFNHGQNTQTLHSAILRIDVSSNSASYTIPSDNPFIDNNNVLDEIYAYGLRNPWRWSFDSQTDELWVADVGQNRIEEVNKVTAGNNLGWPIMEGSECFQSSNCDQTGLTLPVTEYNHDNGECSITGGFVYRSTRLPGLNGNYIYGDFCSGRVFRAEPQNDQTYVQEEMLLTGISITSFAQDANGEVYLLEYNGGAGNGVYRFVNSSSNTGNIPNNLSETGCFNSTSQKTYPEALVPYAVFNELWSDGEDKTRLFAIPDGSSINLESNGDFIFPERSIIVKNFTRDDTYLETRLFMRHINGWAGYSYQWLDDQSDAVLVEGSSSQTVSVNGTSHIIPSRGQCFECHTGAANINLGLEASQLNFEIIYPNGNMGNQLEALSAATYLSSTANTNQISQMASIDDQTASLELRARSYLHSNCSGCHQPGAIGTQLDLRIQTNFTDSMSCDIPPNNGNLGIANARIIAPGDANRSVLLTRMQSTQSNVRMPPLASDIVDSEAVSIVEQWINNLQNCN